MFRVYGNHDHVGGPLRDFIGHCSSFAREHVVGFVDNEPVRPSIPAATLLNQHESRSENFCAFL